MPLIPHPVRNATTQINYVAADDGILRTVPDWFWLKWPTRNPFRDYALRTASPVISWHDVASRQPVGSAS